MHDDVVTRIIAKALIPTIMLFALYVQFHGDFGPGGGFQAGVIFAAAFVLHGLVFGLSETRKVWPPKINQIFIALGALLYGGTGVVGMLRGGNFLDYNVLSENPVAGQHLGILLVELGVGIAVASVMVSLFYSFAGRREHLRKTHQDETTEPV